MIKDNKGTKIIWFTIITTVLIAIFCVALTPVTFQNDTYYTIKVGEHIVQNGIDFQDPFSWHEDLGYTYPHWGYDVITYFIYQIGGFTGIYAVTCLLCVILGISIYFVNTKLAKNKFFSFAITIGVMYLIRGYIAARAQLVTFILFIWTIYFIEMFIKTKKKRYAIPLIIIPIMIANLHVAVFPFYFVLYMPYIAEYIIALLAETIIYQKVNLWLMKHKIEKLKNKLGKEHEKVKEIEEKYKKLEAKVDKIKVKRTKELQNPYKVQFELRPNVKWLIVVMIICIFTGFLTPLGDAPYTYLLKTMQGNTTENINEHLPMTLSQEVDTMCVLVLLLTMLIFTKAKIRLVDLIMLCGLGYLMISSRRQITMFAIVGSVIFNRLVMQVMELSDEKTAKEKLERLTSSIIVMVILTISTLGISYYYGKDRPKSKFVDKKTYPISACDYILENVDLNNAKFYNEYNYGSYMIFRGIPVFIDSRADLYAPEFSGKEDDIFMDFMELSSIGKFYGDIFEKYGITHVICYENSKLNMIITKTDSENYKELYKDDYFVVYELVAQ